MRVPIESFVLAATQAIDDERREVDVARNAVEGSPGNARGDACEVSPRYFALIWYIFIYRTHV